MLHLSRRDFVAGGVGILAAMTQGSAARASETIKLTHHEGDLSSMMRAFGNRQSTRAFNSKELESHTLADLLWAANGINRPNSGGRTAPSWHSSYGSDLWVANAAGVWTYDPKAEALNQRSPDDIRKKISPQPFVATAPIVVLHVVDVTRMHEAPKEDQIRYGYVDTGIIAQNIYLYCASAGLGTCLVGGIEAKALAKALKLGDGQFVSYAQPIGYPQSA